jgi:hypothetical protein
MSVPPGWVFLNMFCTIDKSSHSAKNKNPVMQIKYQLVFCHQLICTLHHYMGTKCLSKTAMKLQVCCSVNMYTELQWLAKIDVVGLISDGLSTNNV